jgi:hypothetical protein
VYQGADFCGAEEVEFDAKEGCLTFTQMEELPLDDESWEKLFEEDEADFEKDDDGYDPSEWN